MGNRCIVGHKTFFTYIIYYFQNIHANNNNKKLFEVVRCSIFVLFESTKRIDSLTEQWRCIRIISAFAVFIHFCCSTITVHAAYRKSKESDLYIQMHELWAKPIYIFCARCIKRIESRSKKTKIVKIRTRYRWMNRVCEQCPSVIVYILLKWNRTL